MIIGIDASRANKERKTGTEWYSYLLIEHLKKIIPSDVTVRLYTRESLRGDIAVLPANWEERILGWPPKYLWTLLRLSWEMWLNSPDLLFIPAHGLPLILPKKTVATIHDIGFEKFPKLYRRRALWYHRFVVRRALKLSSAIITISEWTKKEIISVVKNIKVPIHVIPLAHDKRRYHNHISVDAQREAQKRYNIEAPYFFFIGRLEKKKNISRLMEAFTLFLDRASLPGFSNQNSHTIEYDSFGYHGYEVSHNKNRNRWSLVLIGSRGYGFSQMSSFIKKNKLNDQIKILNWVPESDIPALMAGSSALVFPSLYEGFGIPILESMATGTPVITSDRGATAEVAGKAALLVDPYNVAAISRALQSISRDHDLRDKLRQAGFARASEFSWSNTVQATWETLQGYCIPQKR